MLARPLLLIALQVGAFWPVWAWYVERASGDPDDRWGLVPLVTLGVVLATSPRRDAATSPSLLLPAALTAAYAAAFPFVPPLLRGALALLALGTVCAAMRLGNAGVVGLALLSLPLLPSLQFYLGYPMRLAVAAIAVPLLGVSGLAVVREGVCLRWADHLIAVDAPCSGIRMLWAAMYLALALACFRACSSRRTVAACAVALAAILAANVLRSTTLVHLEAAGRHVPGCVHEGVGIAAFALAAAAIVVAARPGRNTTA